LKTLRGLINKPFDLGAKKLLRNSDELFRRVVAEELREMRFDHPKQGLGLLLAVALAGSAGFAQEGAADGSMTTRVLPNDFPYINANGFSATFSTRGFVDLTGEYFQAP
jgi:hypothetical protein